MGSTVNMGFEALAPLCRVHALIYNIRFWERRLLGIASDL
jgi:hypothetical protein